MCVVGAGGRVGSCLTTFLQERGYDVLPWMRRDVDLSDEEALVSALRALPSDVEAIVNVAAWSDIETCESDPWGAHAVNARAPELMAREASVRGMRFIHFSTDYVLDGRRAGKKDEQAKRKPVNVYGVSKEEAELRIEEAYPRAVLMRVSWVFGNADKPGFPDTLIARMKSGELFVAIGDKWSMPTSMETICHSVESLIAGTGADVHGVLHVCDSGEPVSWFTYAQAVVEAYEKAGGRIRDGFTLGEKSICDGDARVRIERPIHTAMSNARLCGLISVPDWRESLCAYVETLMRR